MLMFLHRNHIQGMYKELTPCVLTCAVRHVFMQLGVRHIEGIALLQVILANLKQQRQENLL